MTRNKKDLKMYTQDVFYDILLGIKLEN